MAAAAEPVNPLMESLGVIVLDEILDQVAQMPFAENDELVQTLAPPDEFGPGEKESELLPGEDIAAHR